MLTLSTVARLDAGTYQCRAGNGVGQPQFKKVDLLITCKLLSVQKNMLVWVNIVKESGALKQSPQTGYWNYFDDFIEDGKLVSVIKRYEMKDGKMENVVDYRHSLTPDKQGNVKWEFMWNEPKRNMKITKVMCAIKRGALFSKC